MADEQYRWLDREAAERLLRGEPLEAVDADTRDQARRLAEALGALAPEPPLSSAEIPGEAAALAAFRTARAGKEGEAVELAHRGRTHPGPHAVDAGLIRLGRPAQAGRRVRWGRPVRFGLAAALAAGMVGGVAVAAGTGVLPTPFSNDGPEPAASVSAAATPDRPLVSPSAGASQTDGSHSPGSDGTSNAPSGKASSGSEARGGSAASARPGSDGQYGGGSRDWYAGVLASCRDLRNGKDLDSDRKRVLEDAAGGKRVKKYCTGILDRADSNSGDSQGSTVGSGDGKGDQGGDGEGHHILPGGSGDQGIGGTPTPSPSALAPLLPRTLISSKAPTPTPSPTYSALSLPTPAP